MSGASTSDSLSESVILDLISSYESKTQINDKAVDSYTLIIDKTTIEVQSPRLIPVISQILLDKECARIDPYQVLLGLLEKILSFLTFQEILNYYPKDFILENLYQSSSIVCILCLKIIILNLHQPETQNFLHQNQVVTGLMELYFDPGTTNIAVLNQIELLAKKLEKEEMNLLDGSNELFFAIRKSKDAILLARFLNLFIILLPKMSQINESLYLFTKSEILLVKDDALFLILLVQFYTRLIDSDLKISPALNDLLTIFKSDDDELELEEIVKLEMVDLIAKMSYSNYTPALDKFELFKTHNLIKLFEKDQVDIKLLSRSNPNVIYGLNPSIFSDVLIHLPLFDDRYFPILLNSINCFHIWQSLEPKLSYEKLQLLPKDKLYTLLLAMSKLDYGRTYLFNHLPNIVVNELIESDIRNNEIWKLKLQILQVLNSTESVPGFEYWKEKLEESYNTMRFGQNYKNIQPKVEVVDETA